MNTPVEFIAMAVTSLLVGVGMSTVASWFVKDRMALQLVLTAIFWCGWVFLLLPNIQWGAP